VERRTTSNRPWPIASAIIGFATLALYLAVILGEGNNEWQTIAVVGLVIAAGAGAALGAALVPSARTARRLLRVSAVLLGALGLLAIFSIGLLLLVAAICSIVGISRLDRAAGR
jgi:peptidoglycan/LPS O-acetylase OafA/YrhL